MTGGGMSGTVMTVITRGEAAALTMRLPMTTAAGATEGGRAVAGTARCWLPASGLSDLYCGLSSPWLPAACFRQLLLQCTHYHDVK